MSTDLARHIDALKMVSTHEHLVREARWLNGGPKDVMQDLFSSYPSDDLFVAGASREAIDDIMAGDPADLERRWSGVEHAWEAAQFTGYGQAVRMKARHVYGMVEITPAAVRVAQARLDELRRPGARLALLQNVSLLDHVQIDEKRWRIEPDPTGPDFFLYDLSWLRFTGLGPHSKGIDLDDLAAETGIVVRDLRTLSDAMEGLLERYGRLAIAIKSQHAYDRTLRWEPRSNAEAEAALKEVLKSPAAWPHPAGIVLGDWSLARAAELATGFDLPLKIHTGFLGGRPRMQHIYDVSPANLAKLLLAYPRTRFVLMHAGYPYGGELISMAKHFPNVYVDLCWGWALNPRAHMEFTREFLHAAPISKLFGFGGDDVYCTSTHAFALQTRHWFAKALIAEVADGCLTEPEAIRIATRVLRENQYACFDVEGRRQHARAALAAAD